MLAVLHCEIFKIIINYRNLGSIALNDNNFSIISMLKGNHSQCEDEREVALAKEECGLIGDFVPSCGKDGSYSLRQCWGSTGYCW
jgi:hypothetical protein